MNIDLEDLAKYPFLFSLKDYLALINFDIEKILEKDNDVLKNSIERIKALFSRKTFKINDLNIAIQSFVTSMYLISHMGSAYIEIFAERESKKLSDYLKEENEEKILILSKQLLNAEIEYKEIAKVKLRIKRIALDLKSYLKYAAYLGDYNWSLSFHEIKSGRIMLNKEALIRLMEEAYRQWIIIKCNEMRELYLPSVEKVLEGLIKEIPIKRKYREEKIEYEGLDPPCMRILLNDLKSGKKLSHMGNFTLATYLRAIGYSVEEALDLFRNLPDFKEEIARYQIEHIYGLRGGRKVYSVPSCITLRAANLCFPESPGCDGIKHPFQYMKKIKRGKRNI